MSLNACKYYTLISNILPHFKHFYGTTLLAKYVLPLRLKLKRRGGKSLTIQGFIMLFFTFLKSNHSNTIGRKECFAASVSHH